MNQHALTTDSLAQKRLVTALFNEALDSHPAKRVRLCETHASWVLLTGCYAYKIKKAVDLGFLDFSTLERRHFFCNEEIRLNRRTAPQIYLDVIPIGGTPDHPVLGAMTAIEYAVKMRRFPLENEMDRLFLSGGIKPVYIDSLAEVLASFHARLPPIEFDSPYGSSLLVRDAVMQSCSAFPPSLLDAVGWFVLKALKHAMADEFDHCKTLIDERRAHGFVRECHGDLHLGNIVVMEDKAVPFDGIEFNPALRWTDVMCDVAFLFMDMQHFGRRDLAYRFLNGWLTHSGDYDGLSLLNFYAAYRAVVRAKVNAIRAAQSGETAGNKAQALTALRKYLSKASHCLARRPPKLILTHGLPGSGKTSFSQMALERFGAIRLRSDVERKRLFGLAPLEQSDAALGAQMYGENASARTYQILHDIAGKLLRAGYCVIVDAAFLKREERECFRQLAKETSAVFVIASIQAEEAVLQHRISTRMQMGLDASEANLDVLTALQGSSEPLGVDEQNHSLTFFNQSDGGFDASDPAWADLTMRLT